MRTLETIATVHPDGKLTLQAPVDMPAGDYQTVLVIEDQPTPKKRAPLNFPVDDYGEVMVDFPLRREEIYGEFGR